MLLPPKSDKSRRVIEIPRVCVEALRCHAERQQQECTWAGSRWKEQSFVFTSTIGTPLDDRKVLSEFTSWLLPPDYLGNASTIYATHAFHFWALRAYR